MSNTVIQRMKCVQFLGLHIDEKLDWHEHINKCKNKLTSALYVIKKVNSYLPLSALKNNLLHLSLPLLDIWNHLVGVYI